MALELEKINRGNQPTPDGAGTDDAWTFTGKINRNFQKLLSFLPSKFGSAATMDIESSSISNFDYSIDKVLQANSRGLGTPYGPSRYFPIEELTAEHELCQFRILVKDSGGAGLIDGEPFNPFFGTLVMPGATRRAALFTITGNASVTRVVVNTLNEDGFYGPSASMWHNKNTTVDGNGFIKEASPVIKLFNNKLEKTHHLEIENAEFEKLGTGHYKLKNVPELSRDGWYIETPKDRNNNIYFTLDYEELDGELIIKTYEPDYSSGKAENGAPIDILEGRFVSLRFAENPELYPEPEEEIGEE